MLIVASSSVHATLSQQPRIKLADLHVLTHMIPATGYLHGAQATSVDAGVYGFIANIHFYDIDTPLKQFVSSHQNLVRHCAAIHEAVTGAKR